MKLGRYITRVTAALAAAAMLVCLGGCGKEPDVQITPAVSQSDGVVAPIGGTDGADIHAGHTDGTRFETTITLEGMPEPVQAEHLDCKGGAFSIDYFYEDFFHQSSEYGDTFAWSYSEDMVSGHYLSISITPGMTAAEVLTYADITLTEGFAQVTKENTTVAGYDAVVAICAAPVDTSYYAADAEVLFYYIDTPHGCMTIEQCCSLEALEGVGARMSAMLATLRIGPAQ